MKILNEIDKWIEIERCDHIKNFAWKKWQKFHRYTDLLVFIQFSFSMKSIISCPIKNSTCVYIQFYHTSCFMRITILFLYFFLFSEITSCHIFEFLFCNIKKFLLNIWYSFLIYLRVTILILTKKKLWQ